MVNIGIGITTRNRPEVLDICLKHFAKFTDLSKCQIVVVDDESEPKFVKRNRQIAEEYGTSVKYIVNIKRKGIAKSKNECLKVIKDYDYIFLFDDDTFPKAIGWEDKFINITKSNPDIQHLMYLSDKFTKINTGKTDGALIEVVKEHDLFDEYGNCFGICLYFTKNVIDTIGGYDKNFDIYGYEHADMSKRAEHVGATGGINNYLAPKNIADYIYSFDTDYHYLKELPPLTSELTFIFDSSINRKKENVKGYIAKNLKVWTAPNRTVYQKL
jgi:GT2 family glycosyltransferase